MLLADIQRREVLEALPVVEGIDPSDAGEHSGYLRVGEWLALPVCQVMCRINGQIDLEILDESGASLGALCLTAKLIGKQPDTFTRWQYVAYLADVEALGAGQPHTFQKNYLILLDSYYSEYAKKYYVSAPVWGGFSHSPPPAPISQDRVSLTARAGIIFPTKFHDMAFSRYVSASNAFERFLRLYHTLELIFDYIVFKSIQKLNEDLEGYGKLSRSHGKSELERLRYILSEYCDDCEGIAARFVALANFEPIATAIFQTHTKDGNPLSDEGKWSAMVEACRAGQTTKADFKRFAISKDHEYETKIVGVAAYWIYRVRSSIAHSRVSEFLFLDADEQFIVDFAEGVLEEVVRQVFSSRKLLELTEE
ncbi:hypothetical protein [Chelatococcus sp.]|uniref:hypothetical protein n=1 Tax=Chelatococcus sp. TaxID=1953771 RepID=UPI001ECFD5BB|nr:hypothetical protein [Chelatococcus sp.]MBX3543562.1 hypothetical protein [Chelatococcus sp.]